ncbi:hypothetical protein L211DRAFT_895487 [Terfezia boudieri ATCC MYA-4762]|uniref:Uncharacterized protein n=1 Tax=Terfezia boudieri ATCC MYA-4762 TaxID=1051890 RepID=A0A3N4LAU9_9PEZI|nr:hypothetical protein L211DRAFT_895487 [Terfezia boudieri ATCC MYA-4762]
MGKKGNLFFPVQKGWDSNKLAAIIDGKAYRTLGSYSLWGVPEASADMRKHIDAIARGSNLLESGKDLPTTIKEIEPAELDTLIGSEKAAIVALVPKDQQMNDTISILPHTTCQVAYCNKPLQSTTPEEDVDMLFRGERESAPSSEPFTNLYTAEEGNIEAYTDPNPYTTELLDLKREKTSTATTQDPDLEGVLNKVCAGLTIEDQILELKLLIEGDQTQRREEKDEERELREGEIAGVLQSVELSQNERRENFRIILETINKNNESFQKAFSLFNEHIVRQLNLLSTQILTKLSELDMGRVIPDSIESTRETSPWIILQHPKDGGPRTTPIGGPSTTTMQFPKDRVIPDSTENSREGSPIVASPLDTLPGRPVEATPPPAMSECFYTTPTGKRYHMTTGTREEAAETLARAARAEEAEKEVEGTNIAPSSGISEKPSRDSFVEGNAPICNLGATGAPLKYSQHGDVSTPPEPSPASSPSNRPEDQPGDKPKTSETKATSAQRPKTGKGDTRVNAFLSQDIVEAEVAAAMEKKEKEERRSAQGDRSAPKHTGPATRRQTTPPAIGARQSTPCRQQSRVGTGANATPITPGKAPRQTTPLQVTPGTTTTKAHLVEGKPGKVQRTPKGNKGYWNKGPENMADISPPPSRPTSVQVLITGCPTIPARGDEWKRSFLVGFNARRERLAPETPICATQVSFAFSYPTERVITIHHPPNMKHEEIIGAVARVRREMYNNYIQHPNQAMISILQETTELVAPGL